MKQILFTSLFFILLLNSCSFFQSKDELLTKEKWILHSRLISNYENGKSTNDMVFYKKTDEVLTLNFKKNGTIRITEDNGKKYATIRWEWRSDDKKYIVLDKGRFTGDFYVLELTGSTLQWSKSDIHSTNSNLETFKHINDKEWDDEKVEIMNEIQ